MRFSKLRTAALQQSNSPAGTLLRSHGFVTHSGPRLCVGWAAKLLNVYLKTAVYIGSLGPRELVAHLHPPIDGGLWSGLEVAVT